MDMNYASRMTLKSAHGEKAFTPIPPDRKLPQANAQMILTQEPLILHYSTLGLASLLLSILIAVSPILTSQYIVYCAMQSERKVITFYDTYVQG